MFGSLPKIKDATPRGTAASYSLKTLAFSMVSKAIRRRVEAQKSETGEANDRT
jgi:hypothetical protein